jgi:exodeoxyribonuclease-3
MRIATWNVNSLKARQEKVDWWLERCAPDVLLMQETKLADRDAPMMAFGMAGYQLVHHGEGRWNGVAIAVRDGLAIDGVVTNFGDGPVRDSSAGAAAGGDEEDFDPSDEARMVSVRVAAPGAHPIRVVSLYAPNGRVVDSVFYEGKLRWFARLRRWLDEPAATDAPGGLLLGGDLNVAPTDADVWDPRAAHGGTHVSSRERAAVAGLAETGLVDLYRTLHPEPARFTWWDYRAGNFQKNIGMRIDHLLASAGLAARLVAVDIDREARKGKPTPADHAPVVADLDAPGRPFDPGWAGAEARIAARGGIR